MLINVDVLGSGRIFKKIINCKSTSSTWNFEQGRTENKMGLRAAQRAQILRAICFDRSALNHIDSNTARSIQAEMGSRLTSSRFSSQLRTTFSVVINKTNRLHCIQMQ